jgi:hypothetical protein
MDNIITANNYKDGYYRLGKWQAGVSEIFDHLSQKVTYNLYCVDLENYQEAISQEFHRVDDAINALKDAFGNWPYQSFDQPSSHSSCFCHREKPCCHHRSDHNM